MSIFAIILMLAGIFYAFFSARRGSTPPMLAIVAILLINAQLLLVEQVVGGVPVRVVLFFVGVIALILGIAQSRPLFLAERDVRLVAGLWLAYAFCVLLAFAMNGTVRSISDLIDFFSRYGFAFVALCLLSGVARAPGGAVLLSRWLYLIALANFAFVVLQLLNFRPAFDLHASLFPDTKGRETALIAEGLISTFGYLPGLSSYSIITGYMLTCFGVLGIGLTLRKKIRTSSWLLVLLAVVAVVGGGVAILSRSTILVGGIVCLVALMVLLRGVARAGVLAALGFAFIIAISVGVSFYDVATRALPGIVRLETLNDPGRLMLLTRAASLIADNLLVGAGPQTRAAAGLAIGGHNFLSNAMMYFGLLGTIPLLLFLGASLYSGWRAVRAARHVAGLRALTVCAYAGMVGYVLKSLFHNESLVTSGILYAMLLGITLGASHAATAQQRATESRPARMATPQQRTGAYVHAGR